MNCFYVLYFTVYEDAFTGSAFTGSSFTGSAFTGSAFTGSAEDLTWSVDIFVFGSGKYSFHNEVDHNKNTTPESVV